MIGVGLNLSIPDDGFPDDLRWPATSLGHGVGAAQALGGASGGARALDRRRARMRWSRRSTARDALRGREVGWEAAGGAGASGAGRAEGIDDRGNLVVVTDAGERLSLGAGEVSLRL